MFEIFLDRLNDSATTSGVRFTPMECKMVLQNRVGLKLNLVLMGQYLG